MKKIIILSVVASGLLSSCAPQRGVKGTWEVTNGKHTKLSKGAAPSCLQAWPPNPQP